VEVGTVSTDTLAFVVIGVDFIFYFKVFDLSYIANTFLFLPVCARLFGFT